MTTQFSATANRDGRWWVVQCDQHPSALSQVSRLDQAVAHQREAIAFVTGLDQDRIEVEVRPALSPTLAQMLSEARTQRAEGELLQREASAKVVEVVSALLDDGYSLRDIGSILGVSHQRVAQLVRP